MLVNKKIHLIMFSPPIINTYINQLEELKIKNIDDHKTIYNINSKIFFIKNIKVDTTVEIDYTNSWLLYYIGYFTETDKDKWYLKSAELGNKNAIIELGTYYFSKNQYEKGVEWYMKSANLNNPHAMNYLGNYYEYKTNNYKLAIEWYIKSFNSGSWDARDNLLKIQMTDYTCDIFYEHIQICSNKDTKEMLINKLPSMYLYNKLENLKIKLSTQLVNKLLQDL